MHRLTQDHLEEVLAGKLPAGHQVTAHLKGCPECSDEVDAMRLHNQLLRTWSLSTEAEVEPAPGFYARVLERIEAQRPVSIWAMFAESFIGRQMLTASLALAIVTVGFAVMAEETAPQEFAARTVSAEMDPLYPSAGFANDVMASTNANNSGVLMSLVSYQGR